jgi:peroxiredoxin
MKYFLLVVFTGMSAGLLAQVELTPKRFSLKGTIIGQDNGLIHLKYTDNKGRFINDSCLLKDGHFEFTGHINGPTLARLYGKIKSRSVDDPNFTELYIDATNMTAIMKFGHFKEGEITGSETQDEYADYMTQSNELDKKWQPVLTALDEAREKNDTVTEKELIDNKIPLYKKDRDSLRMHFILQHPSSFVSVNLLVYQIQNLSSDSLKAIYASLSENVQNSWDGKFIKDFIAKSDDLLPGKQLPNFTQIDKDGKLVSLKDFLGKYVLVDFWASWCIPCRQEHPFLKKAFEKYNAKGFTIISFSLDKLEDKNKWLAAIEKDNLTWPQLCDFKVWSGDVVSRYNLQGRGIPSNFLIDPDGKIVARDLRGEEVEIKLNQLLK